MENLVIIPARGGSKRIPKKNINPFHGKPLISYSIDIAKKSGLFKEIMVSTDDREIADIALKYGAKVPFFRGKKNSDHFATLADVVTEVISTYQNLGKSFQHICLILPTAPLITLSNLKKGYDLLLTDNYNSIRPVVRFSYPIQRAFSMKNGVVEFINPENLKARSQDLEPTFHDAGQFYWMYFEKGMINTKRGGFEISEMEAQDIDTLTDLKLAEIKYSLLNSD
ncbi:MAG: pseudaminic acid cytidylyltransferase [Bacteroidales bacterium]|nr:pseudaminic acid cytidylyltransferase [Bacteroidales bacterium]